MYYSYVEIEYVATSFSPSRTDLAVKLLRILNKKREEIRKRILEIIGTQRQEILRLERKNNAKIAVEEQIDAATKQQKKYCIHGGSG